MAEHKETGDITLNREDLGRQEEKRRASIKIKDEKKKNYYRTL